MEALLVYLLKMVICSAVLFGYYRLALYNEKFHQWNRFYLLASLLLSVTVPFIHIPLFVQEETADIAAIMTTLPWHRTVEAAPADPITWQLCLTVTVALISALLLAKVVVGIVRLVSAYHTHPVSKLDERVQLIVTDYQHAPFSFFSWLFWRNDIDPASETGRRMLTHELAHIEQRHSWDKIATELLLGVFWMNPFFWLIRRELSTIHEFLADHKAIGKQDGAAFAAMILHAMQLQPAGTNGLVNPFYTSQIKRRLFMITTSQEPRYSYLRRISGLGIMIAAVVLLTVSLQRAEAQQIEKKKQATPAGKMPLPKVVMGKPLPAGKAQATPADTVNDSKKRQVISILPSHKIAIGEDNSPNEEIDEMLVEVEKGEGSFSAFEKRILKESKEPPLYIIDGREITAEEMEIKPADIASVRVLNGKTAMKYYGDRGKNGVILITSKSKETITGEATKKEPLKEVVVMGQPSKKVNPVVYVNGKQIPFAEMNDLQPNDIEKIEILKGEKAIEKYGEKGKNGIIEITMKKPVT